jgi:hypothetical protein
MCRASRLRACLILADEGCLQLAGTVAGPFGDEVEFGLLQVQSCLSLGAPLAKRCQLLLAGRERLLLLCHGALFRTQTG